MNQPNNPQEPVESPQDPQGQMDPKTEKEVQAYVLGLSKMLHSKQTSPKVLEMLKAGEPEKTIPHTAMMLNQQMEDAVRAKGKSPSLDTLFAAGQFLVGDLIEIGNAAGIFQLETEEQIAPIVQNTFQVYIEKGLKDGTIDPIELQKKVEPLMSDEHKQLGLQAAQRTGVPEQPDETTAMEMYAMQRSKKGALQGGR
jgi:hypothetical protein